MRISQAEYVSLLARTNTRPEPSASEGVTDEGKLHDEILAECGRRGWLAIHSRMDRPTTTVKGVPDFVILCDGGRMLFVEAKTRTGKLSTEQAGFIAWAEKLGHVVHTVRSMDEFLTAAREGEK